MCFPCLVIPKYKFVDIPVAKEVPAQGIKGVKGVGIDHTHDDHYEEHDGYGDFRRKSFEKTIDAKIKSPKTAFFNRHMFF